MNRDQVVRESNELLARAEAAEAELASVREERDALKEQITAIHAIANGPKGWMTRCKTAEARVEQLEGALREIVLWCDEGGEPVCAWVADRARTLFAPITTQADQTGDTT